MRHNRAVDAARLCRAIDRARPGMTGSEKTKNWAVEAGETRTPSGLRYDMADRRAYLMSAAVPCNPNSGLPGKRRDDAPIKTQSNTPNR